VTDVDPIDWSQLTPILDGQGWVILKQLMPASACRAITSLYEDERQFRSRVVMARHGFGSGEYKYFRYPLLPDIAQLRSDLYPHLSALANTWSARLKLDIHFPSRHCEFLDRCHQSGQSLPTPLLLRYREGDYNCLHQDLYGEHVFPLQMAVLLSEPGRDFTGGEFILTEQRPRMQSRATVVPLNQGDAVVFAVRERPVRGSRGDYRVNQRHGVSKLLSGERYTLGVIFHDAR
jgi:hypothetical protein